MAPIQMRVLRNKVGWRVQYGDVSLEYSSRDLAVAAAIQRAKRLAKDGQVVAVVMDVITSIYGAGGFIRTIPTRRKAVPTSRLPLDAYEELIKSSVDLSSPSDPTLSPVRNRLSAATEEGTRRVGNAVDAARETLSDALDEKGVNAEGLKEAARDVTKAAKSSLSGLPNGRRPGGDGRSPGSGGPSAKPGSTSSVLQKLRLSVGPMD